ncbi:hypothetical protein Chor_012225 [Crotalus horridus]
MGNLFGRKRQTRVTEQDKAVLHSRKAKLLLKKKRYEEQLLDKTENQISNLERMVHDIEFTQIEMKVIEGLKIGNECLNRMHQQIDEILSGSLTTEDEDAILAELDAITQEQIDLPEVPSEPLPERISESHSMKRLNVSSASESFSKTNEFSHSRVFCDDSCPPQLHRSGQQMAREYLKKYNILLQWCPGYRTDGVS